MVSVKVFFSSLTEDVVEEELAYTVSQMTLNIKRELVPIIWNIHFRKPYTEAIYLIEAIWYLYVIKKIVCWGNEILKADSL